jgi:hypothetical protein
LINDPSLELRRDTVALAIGAASRPDRNGGSQAGGREGVPRSIHSRARDLDQIEAAAAKLKSSARVDLPNISAFS